jgi:hypothetical protein
MQGGFADFKTAPGGAATWLYVLSGRQVLVLLPPTAKNRYVAGFSGFDHWSATAMFTFVSLSQSSRK